MKMVVSLATNINVSLPENLPLVSRLRHVTTHVEHFILMYLTFNACFLISSSLISDGR